MTDTKIKDVNAELIVYRLDEIKAELASFKREYVTKAESAELRHEIAGLRIEVHAMKKEKGLLNWLYPTVSAALSAVVTYLLIEFLKNK